MNILIIGGTIFVGRRTARMLKDAGHNVAVLHRGTHEPDDLTDLVHIHGDRNDLPALSTEIHAFAPDIVWDNLAMSKPDAAHVVSTLGKDMRYVMTSSCDVYKMYGALHAGVASEPVPADEEAPVRPERYPYKGQIPGFGDTYEKLDVEDIYLEAGATVLRYPMCYGPNDGQRREWFVLSRVHAGRKQIPIGSGTWLTTKGYAEDIANGTKLAIENENVGGEIFNLGEKVVYDMGNWTKMILEAAGSDAELVRVPDDKLPEDMGLTGFVPQHLVTDCAKARRVLGTTDTDHLDALKTTVTWHLANPPQVEADFSADDAALALAIAP
jgi:nucleoside-diphosphate-sugar epimerase